MKAYTYIDKGHFALLEKPEPKILDLKDAIVKVTLASICTSDLHIKHGYVNNCQSPDTTTLITHRYSLENFEEAYRVFENREDGVIKVAVDCLRPVVI